MANQRVVAGGIAAALVAGGLAGWVFLGRSEGESRAAASFSSNETPSAGALAALEAIKREVAAVERADAAEAALAKVEARVADLERKLAAAEKRAQAAEAAGKPAKEAALALAED